MKELFPGYYRPTEEEFKKLWEECIFILDTNVLLNLYRYDEDTRNEFLGTLEKIKDRLWIPHQVALEFQENRYRVVKEEEKKIDKIKSTLQGFCAEVMASLSNFPSVDSSDFVGQLEKVCDDFVNALKPVVEKQLSSDEHDYIRERIDSVLNGSIGKPPDGQQELDKIYEEGDARYKINYPPGFKDLSGKKDSSYLYERMVFSRKYGDLIVWKQILKSSVKNQWKHVLFITDDNKEDWWRIESGKTVGARPELAKEIFDAGVKSFYMYNSERFLLYAKEYLKVKIKDASIQNVESVTEYQRGIRRPSEITNQLNKVLYIETCLKSVYRWLSKYHPENKVEICEGPGPFDIMMLKSDGRISVYDVKASRNTSPHSLMQIRMIFDRLMSYLSKESKIDNFYVVFAVTSATSRNLEKITYFFEKKIEELKESIQEELPVNIHLLVGLVSYGGISDSDEHISVTTDSSEFLPIYSTDPKIMSNQVNESD